ncbi:hypothetical protein [Roseomonas mucosa]|uniref:hypothetical protein n=1 Tax=Roseomonas mucosa TaxID=207340 RepID=UPI00224618D2|nr:hypothetical protein [Roseomonas mucosa]
METAKTEGAAALAEMQGKLEEANKQVENYTLNWPVDNFVNEVAVEADAFNTLFGALYEWKLFEGKPAVFVKGSQEPVRVAGGDGSPTVLGCDSHHRLYEFLTADGTAPHENAPKGRLAALFDWSLKHHNKASGSGASGGGASGGGSGERRAPMSQGQSQGPSQGGRGAAPPVAFGLR